MQWIPDENWLPERTRYGRGERLHLIAQGLRWGSRGVLVHGASLERSGHLDEMLEAAGSGVEIATWRTPSGEPTLAQLDALLGHARAHSTQWVAGVGGGSAMDLAKACAGLLNCEGGCADYHDGAVPETEGVPFLAAPTTAGSGSEATRVSVLTNGERRVKKSMRHASFLARLVVLDPDLLAGSPAQVVADSGMDALTQAIESFLSRKATWFSRQLARKGIELVHANIERAREAPEGEAAEGMLVGSHLAALAFGTSRLGVVHGLAHPLGLRYAVPHGRICGYCLPHALEFNRPAIGPQYEDLCGIVGGDIVERVQALLKGFEMDAALSDCVLEDRDAIVEEVLASGSTAANPREVGRAEAEQLLGRLFA